MATLLTSLFVALTSLVAPSHVVTCNGYDWHVDTEAGHPVAGVDKYGAAYLACLVKGDVD
jgi:hypothetical protein